MPRFDQYTCSSTLPISGSAVICGVTNATLHAVKPASQAFVSSPQSTRVTTAWYTKTLEPIADKRTTRSLPDAGPRLRTFINTEDPPVYETEVVSISSIVGVGSCM